MPLTFWSDAFVTSYYLINHLPSSPLKGRTHLELFFGSKPYYNVLKSFGCLCYPYLRPYALNKLEKISLDCVFIGYCSAQKGYMCYNQQSKRLYISCHVDFEEDIFPYSAVNNYPTTVSTSSISTTPLPSTSILPVLSPSPNSTPSLPYISSIPNSNLSYVPLPPQLIQNAIANELPDPEPLHYPSMH